MGSEWPTCSLKEAEVQLIDCDHKTPKAQETGFPYIGIPQMKAGNIDFDAAPRLISQSDLVTWTKKAKPQTNDVILSRRCNPGESAHVSSRTGFALGQNLVILRASGERVFPPYLRWVVRSHQWWAEVSKYLNPGAIFDSLKCADIPKFKVPFPPLPEQKAIAHMLGSLDDKIDLNRKMNATLEAMAQALFKSWFVDFDPVLDNVLRKNLAKHPSPNLSQGERDLAGSSPSGRSGDEGANQDTIFNGIPEELLARAEIRRQAIANGTANEAAAQPFPSAFQKTEELGWIPEGWNYDRADDIATISIGKTPPRKESKWFSDSPENTVPWASIRNMGNCGVFINDTSEYLTKEAIETFNIKVTPKHTVILSFKLTLGRVAITQNPMATNEAIAHFINSKEGLTPDYIYCYLSCFDYSSLGSTSSIATAVNSKIIKAMPILNPDAEPLSLFSQTTAEWFNSIASHSQQLETLTKLRDTLLPKLISGELRISDAEQLTEEALA